MRTTKIEWTERTWNPITGCTKQSAGCAHCYAETMARRLKAMGMAKYANGFLPTMHPEEINEPRKWSKGCQIFVCSMSDLFHPDVPFDFIDQVMTTIRETPQHRYQLLTKRAERMAEYFSNRPVPSNAWLGVTVECANTKTRMDALRAIRCQSVKFLSCEPLLEDLGEMDFTGIDWVIVGGESGPLARPMDPNWVRKLYAQAKEQQTAFFFKQWGTYGADGVKRSKHANGKLIDGQLVQQMPCDK